MEDFHISNDPDHLRLIQELEERIYEHNSKEIARADGYLFAIVARSETGAIIGGIAGWTWAGAAEITQLWVNERYRKLGIGEKLLKSAETEVRSKGSRTILIRTFSFQAPAFYEKYGYSTTHIIDGFPAGHRYHILLKEIARHGLPAISAAAD